MFSRSKLLIFIPTIILLPILLGMTPLNFVHKIGNGCPLSHDKQVMCNFCPFNSIVSHDDTTIIIVDSILLEQLPPDPLVLQLSGLDSHPSPIRLSSLPLRC
jgi:hypothetical protein